MADVSLHPQRAHEVVKVRRLPLLGYYTTKRVVCPAVGDILYCRRTPSPPRIAPRQAVPRRIVSIRDHPLHRIRAPDQPIHRVVGIVSRLPVLVDLAQPVPHRIVTGRQGDTGTGAQSGSGRRDTPAEGTLGDRRSEGAARSEDRRRTSLGSGRRHAPAEGTLGDQRPEGATGGHGDAGRARGRAGATRRRMAKTLGCRGVAEAEGVRLPFSPLKIDLPGAACKNMGRPQEEAP